jgi:hypothetical protein
MPASTKKDEIASSLRELITVYVANVNQCEAVLAKLSRQLELDEPVSIRDALRDMSLSRGNRLPFETPHADPSLFCAVYGKRRCFLGNTLPFWLFAYLSQRLNRYVSYEQLLADVWQLPKRSNETIRNAVQILRKKLARAGLVELAAAIDGRNRGHYGLILNRQK